MKKQVTIIIVSGVAILGVGVALFLAQPKPNSEHQDMNMASQEGVLDLLQTDKTFYDFGKISMKNGLVTTVFKIKNTQTEPVTLSKLYTSCMCTKAQLKLANKTEGPFGMLGHGFIPTFNDQLQPNEEAEIEVIFDPNAHGPSGVGVIEREVTLENEQGKLANLQIKADVTP